MNVPFTLANPELEKQFLQEAKETLLNLAGHRSVGGKHLQCRTVRRCTGIGKLHG